MSLRRSLLLLIPTIPALRRSSISASVSLLLIPSVLRAAVPLLLLPIALLAVPLLLPTVRLLTVAPLLPVRRLLRLVVPPAQLRQEAAKAALFARVARRQLLRVVARRLPLPLSVRPALLRPALVVAVALAAVQRLGARGTARGAGAGVFFRLELLGVAGVFVEVLVRGGALGTAVGVVGAETLFGRVGVCARAGGVGGAAAGGGIACAGVGGWWAGRGAGGGGVDGGGGAVPGGLLGVDVYVEPVVEVSVW